MFDASAYLAIIQKESGAKQAEQLFRDASISSVNLAEVCGRLNDAGVAEDQLDAILKLTAMPVVDFTEDHAKQAGRLRPITRSSGLSLGDRACLALARSLDVPAVTADREWEKIAEAVGVEIIQIR